MARSCFIPPGIRFVLVQCTTKYFVYGSKSAGILAVIRGIADGTDGSLRIFREGEEDQDKAVGTKRGSFKPANGSDPFAPTNVEIK
jgi:hypothetical protein